MSELLAVLKTIRPESDFAASRDFIADGMLDSFDVITLVADPERVLSECARVVKPGGQIILVNHLYSEHGLAAAVERLLAQNARAVGLRPEFPFQRLAAWAQSHGGTELIERRKIKPFGVYTLVRFRRGERQSAAA